MKIQDVARRANVGVGTVSRVLNNNGYVSEKTRLRVEEAIRELQYIPNELARNLYRNKNNTIAVIVPDVASPFYAAFVNEVEKNLRTRGYKALLCNTVGEKTNEELYLNMLHRNIVDGIITASHTLDKWKYTDMTGPIVSFDTPPLSEQTPVVTVDHREGGRMAAKLLLQSGCKKVIQFHDNVFENFPFTDRHTELAKIMREAGCQCISYILEKDCFMENYYERIAADCFERYPDLDGIFATDMPAVFCMKRALSLGKKIPEDVRIVSFDGTYITRSVYPQLTCIRQPIDGIAQKSVERLIDMIEGNERQDMEIKLPVTIERGMST